jgi:hypothetical protein
MNADQLIEKWESSLSHAQGNYQMVVITSLANNELLTKDDLVNHLMLANKGKTQSFFNSHCVFKVLKNKDIIKQNAGGLFSLNLTKCTPQERKKIVKAAIKARKKYEADHK